MLSFFKLKYPIIGCIIICIATLFNLPVSGQTVAEILNGSMDSISKIKTIQYTGNVVNSSGTRTSLSMSRKVIAERSPDSIFNMKYIVEQGSLEYIFDGRFAFQINHKHREVSQINPLHLKKKDIQNLFAKELFGGYEKEAYKGEIINSDDSLKYYTISYHISIKGQKTVKKISINRQSGIPEKFESSTNKNGKKDVTLLALSETMINGNSIPKVDTRIIAYLDKYTLLPIGDIGIPTQKDARDSLVGKKAPDFLLKSFDNKEIKLSDLNGKLILLDFWELWCGPCRMSLPHLQQLHEKYKAKGLVILGITKDNIAAARGLLANRKITYENLAGTDQVAGSYKALEIPQYYLIDKKGIIIYASKNGFEKKIEDLIAILSK